MSRHLERGAFMVIAIMVVVVVGIMTVALGFLSTANMGAGSLNTASGRALYAALAGLEVGASVLAGPDSANWLGCDSTTTPPSTLDGAAILTNATFDTGGVSSGFTVTRQNTSYNYASTSPAVITATILNTAGVRVLPLTPASSIGQYAASGGIVMLGREVFTYTGVSTTAATCSGAGACLIGVTRAAGGTTALTHVTTGAGTRISQFQCRILSTGSHPSSNPSARRVMAQAVQMQEVWVAGAPAGVARIGRFIDNTWEDYSSNGMTAQLNRLEVINYADAWVVGNWNGQRPQFARWNGSSWARLPTASVTTSASAFAANQNMLGIYCIDINQCYSVGQSVTTNPMIMQWNGLTWNRLAAGTAPAIAGAPNPWALNGVYCTASNNCYAVGHNCTTCTPLGTQYGETIMRYNGATWARNTPSATIPNTVLNDVHCFGSSVCWIVGAATSGNAVFVTLTTAPNTWSFDAGAQPSPANAANVNGVFCPASNDCWAVGTNGASGVIFRWQPSVSPRWILQSNVPTNSGLNKVTCTAINNCWAVGVVSGGAENILHWDGGRWTQMGITAGKVGDVPFADVGAVSAVKDRAVAIRQEVFR